MLTKEERVKMRAIAEHTAGQFDVLRALDDLDAKDAEIATLRQDVKVLSDECERRWEKIAVLERERDETFGVQPVAKATEPVRKDHATK